MSFRSISKPGIILPGTATVETYQSAFWLRFECEENPSAWIASDQTVEVKR